MNRLSARPASPQSSAGTRALRPVVRSAPRHDAPHCLLAPLHYEPNYAYPLLVWLHGPSGDEQELKRIMPLVSLRNYVSLGVRGAGEERRGFAWPQTPDAILPTELPIAAAVTPVAMVGFAIAAISGSALLATKATAYLHNPFVYIKFPAIALGLINVLALNLSPAWKARGTRELSRGEQRQLAVMGGISLACWLTAVSAGRMIGYW